MTTAIIAVCGGLGALTRFSVDAGLRRLWPIRYPLATFLINVTGSGLLGFVLAYLHGGAATVAGAAIGTGFCGGYTTFSTAMVETAALARERRSAAAVGYLLSLPVACVLAAAVGYALGA